MSRLLAKSGQDAPSLKQHSADVVAVFDALFGSMDRPSYWELSGKLANPSVR